MQKRNMYIVIVICTVAYILMSDALIENGSSVVEAVLFLALENALTCATWYFLGKVSGKEDRED